MKVYFLSMLLVAFAIAALAHGGKKHKKDSIASQTDSLKQEGHAEHAQGDTIHHHNEGMKVDESKVTAELSDFPSLHPLIVHFVIGFIIIAAAIQLLNVFLLKKEIAWIIAGLLFIGFLAAWFASKNLHPHTRGLSEHAKLVLKQHDKWADWTIYTTIAGLIAQFVYLFFIRQKEKIGTTPVEGLGSFASNRSRGFAVVVSIILLSSAFCVSKAGHYGAQLVHIEGIGPQGKFLEMEHDH